MTMSRQIRMLPAMLIAAVALTTARAENGASAFSDWNEPDAVNNLEGFSVAVRFQAPGTLASAAYRYPDGTAGTAEGQWDADVVSFQIPAQPNAGMGPFAYAVEIGTGTAKSVSAERLIPMVYAEELDVTGEAAEVLPYPLPGDDYLVRYIPCCNIYGGITYAERTPVNPTETAEGLPDSLVSDFVILEPDPLCASTMGLYFRFTYDEARLEGRQEADVALFEFNGIDQWSEVLSFDVDTEANAVDVHFPDGGILVLGLRP